MTLCRRIRYFSVCVSISSFWTLPASAAVYRIIAQTQEQGIIFPLAADAAGNLYGISEGSNQAGVSGRAFRLDATTGYAQETVLYTFNDDDPTIGELPDSPVTLARGQIFVEAASGGANDGGTVLGLGKPNNVTPIVLHAFKAPKAAHSDGFNPAAGLEPLSNRYFGVAANGGANGGGTIFSIRLSTTEPSFKLLHSFGGAGDGAYPAGGRLVVDSTGRFFGETVGGGGGKVGTVYMLQEVNGGWQEQVIFSFSANPDLNYPDADLVMDAAGNLYGCATGGTHGQGGVFRLSPPAQEGRPWQETILYAFGGAAKQPLASSSNKGGPGCGIALDANGTIFGTSWGGGNHGWGTIFSLKQPAGGAVPWQLHVIHSFYGPSQLDGGHPVAAPFKVGDTYYGGNSRNGAIYAFTPN